jgi:hypothetical protein
LPRPGIITDARPVRRMAPKSEPGSKVQDAMLWMIS